MSLPHPPALCVPALRNNWISSLKWCPRPVGRERALANTQREGARGKNFSQGFTDNNTKGLLGLFWGFSQLWNMGSMREATLLFQMQGPFVEATSQTLWCGKHKVTSWPITSVWVPLARPVTKFSGRPQGPFQTLLHGLYDWLAPDKSFTKTDSSLLVMGAPITLKK